MDPLAKGLLRIKKQVNIFNLTDRLEDLNTHPKEYRLLQGSLLWLRACMLTPSAHLVFIEQG